MFSHVGCVVSGISDQALNESVLRDFNIAEVAERAHAPSESADIVVLTTNSWSDWHLALSIAKFGGSILVLGFPGRGEPLPTKNPLDSSLFYAKQLVVRAIGHMPDVDCDRSDLPRTLKRNCEEILRLLMSGRLPGHAVVKEFYPYSRLGEIYSQLSTGKRITPQTFGLIWEQS
jgi:threonine dehydrogenase-like Zn-dependent dehydrogenase